jgi:periplasmic divalent cation tolerance protein
MTDVCLVLTTLPDEAGARELAQALVQARLAACVQLREVHSVYRWQGKVEAGAGLAGAARFRPRAPSLRGAGAAVPGRGRRRARLPGVGA